MNGPTDSPRPDLSGAEMKAPEGDLGALTNALYKALSSWPTRSKSGTQHDVDGKDATLALAKRTATVLSQHGHGVESLEASIRGGIRADTPLTIRGQRMMVEHVDAMTLRALMDVLLPPSLSLPDPLVRALEQADTSAIPLIAGWDADVDSPKQPNGHRNAMVKVYFNLSDRREADRRAFLSSLPFATPGFSAAHSPPSSRWPPAHVLGLNLSWCFSDQDDNDNAAWTTGTWKLYEQRPVEMLRLQEPCWEELHLAKQQNAESAVSPRWPAALVNFAAGLPLAGGIISRQVPSHRTHHAAHTRPATNTHAGTGLPIPRAFFVTPRQDAPIEHALRRLPGWDDAQASTALPFPCGQIKSVGFDAKGERWTLYAKPPSYRGALWRLDPNLIVAHAGGELGLYVVPLHGNTEDALRAYAQTQHHALSYRTRSGAPPRHAIEAIMRWAQQQVRAAEAQGGAIGALDPSPAAPSNTTTEAPSLLDAGALLPEGWHVPS